MLYEVITNNPWWVTDGMTNIIERIQSEGMIVRDDRIGGLLLSVTGTRNVAVTAGQLWSRINEFPIPALDTSITGNAGGPISATIGLFVITSYSIHYTKLYDVNRRTWYFSEWSVVKVGYRNRVR